jgi:hypothetical protein
LAKISELENLMDVSKKEIERLVNSEREIDNTLVLLREKELKKGENRREAEREYYELKSKHAELLGRAIFCLLKKMHLKRWRQILMMSFVKPEYLSDFRLQGLKW